LGAILLLAVSTDSALKEGECEVCISAINEFSATLSEEQKKNTTEIENCFKTFCKKTTKDKVKRFCYYLGGLEESATGILGELSRPLSYSKPAYKICEDNLKKKDAQICELRFEKQIDLSKVDLKKLKVKDLKKVLNDWDEVCEGCIEKSDFIKRIEELKPKYTQKVELWELPSNLDELNNFHINNSYHGSSHYVEILWRIFFSSYNLLSHIDLELCKY